MDFEKMPIALTDSQRELLLKYESNFADQRLFIRISLALKRGEKYEILLDDEGLQDLLDEISEFSDLEEDEETQNQLDNLCECLVDYYNDMQEKYDEEDDDDDDEHSEFSSDTGSVCVLKVCLINSKIWRKVAIRQGQTLHDLHNIIFDAFDRYDEHMYSFYIPHSRKKFNPRTIRKSSDEFAHPYACEDQGIYGSETQDASLTSIENLNLSEKQKFYYLFDFGDEWWHEITVVNTDEPADDQEYPRIVERKGDSPEQYPDYDEDDEDEDN